MPATLFSPTLTPSVHAVTSGAQHHFFGYYDKSPWDVTGRWILGMAVTFMDRPPTENDVVEIGLIDTQTGNAWTPLAESRAWNWQQGCMLQWLDEGRAGDLIFNDRQDSQFVARVLNIHTRRERTLPRPVYAVNHSGTHGASLNFSRLHHQRPGYGYAGVADPWLNVERPADDGIFSLDLATGEDKLIYSVAQAAEYQPLKEFADKMHRFNHLQFSPSGNRFAVLHRYRSPEEEVGRTRLLTMNLDGSDVHCLSDHGLVSHYDWRDADSILAWANREGIGHRYFLFNDRTAAISVIGEDVFSSDGHCSFSPDRQWMLTDTYPDAELRRTLMLFHWKSGRRVDLGRFYSPKVQWQIRCDLHPRWSRDGRQICIDSVHEGSRQMYVLDVSEIVG